MGTTFVISVVSTKGGVGKTTITANLGGLFADLARLQGAVDGCRCAAVIVALLRHGANRHTRDGEGHLQW